jgi:subtilisin family serine protease
MDTMIGQAGVNRAVVPWPPMNALGPSWPNVVTTAHAVRRRTRAAALLALLCLPAAPLSPHVAGAAPFIWDQDGDRVDDRVETVNLLGYTLAFEEGDSLLRKRIDVTRIPGGLAYGVYVSFQQTPTDSDMLALTALGMPVLHRYEEIPTLRSVATFAQVEAAAAIPGVERVEAVPILYPVLREAAAGIGVRDLHEHVFPTWSGMGGATGEGIVVAILDTGINDEQEGNYPGHESLIGRCLGGAVFTHGDSTLDTPRNGSVNPSDHGGSATQSHGTHVAGIVLGSGGPTGYAMGVAPLARFIDVKVLNDVGVGTGVAEALDWCIHNRARDWGEPGHLGIDVVNLSLSSLDLTDGNDVASRLADRAVQRGMVLVASMGNEGLDHYVPSPAGGDGVLAIGALDGQRTALNDDDRFAAFSAYGPRASDGDADAADEAKPDLLAPGVAVLSADGDLVSDGAQYQRLSGTSMAAAFVSGVVAALRSAYPALTPAEIADLLRVTGYRPLGDVPVGVGGPDPGWHSPIGFGAVDLHAALMEIAQPGRSQVRRLELQAGPTEITATLRTQRELGAAFFVFERAADAGGVPEAFAAYDSVPAAGDPSLTDGTNLQSYTRAWNVPGNERGEPFWYRVSYTEGGARHDGPSRRFVSPVGPPAATVEVTIVHNAYDTDVDAAIEVGVGAASGATGDGLASPPPALVYPLPGSGAAVASDWETGISSGGNIAWSFAIDIPQGAASPYLPPGPGQYWRLKLTEGGLLNRSGRITQYRVIWHAPGGDQVVAGGPLPVQTFEGVTAYAWAPTAVVGVAAPELARGLRIGPNPLRGGAMVTFVLASAPHDDLRVFDLAGREVGRAPFREEHGAWNARWVARDGQGRPLPAGLYLARAGSAGVGRLVVLGR